jgi:Neurochondrin
VLVTKRPTIEGRTAYSNCAAALIQTYPNICPNLLFQNNKIFSGDEKPFSYLFINLLLIDIRSSFPSLLSKLHSPEYVAVSKRLAAAFDIISSFVGFLVRSLDDDSDGSSTISFNMPPDLLLRLRKGISETISLTIEYLRDRWDFAVAGVAGLHPLARTETAATSEGTRFTLTWDSMKVDVSTDSLVLSSIRTLAIWLHEDDNESLRKETLGLMDMFIELYENSSSAALNFRFPILMALESIINTDGGADAFINQGGWEILSQDLARSTNETLQRETNEAQQLPNLIEANASRGIEIVRVLLAIVDQQSSILESWMNVVKATATMKHFERIRHPLIMELQIAILQLAAALLSSATSGMQKRYVPCTAAILGLVAQLLACCDQFSGLSGEEFRESLDDIAISLENLR